MLRGIVRPHGVARLRETRASMSDTISPTNRDLDRLDVAEIRRFVARRWKLVLACAFGCAILALIFCLAVTPTYTATSQVLLDPHKQHVFGQETVNPDSSLDSSIVDSQIPIITSNHLLSNVIVEQKLNEDPEFAAPTKPGLLARLTALFQPPRTSSVEAESKDGIDPKLAPVITNLFKKIDVTRVAKSYVLIIAVSSRDADKAMRLANALAEAYVADQVGVRARSVQQTATFFEQRLGKLREQVRDSERAVTEFRRTHDLLTTTTMDGKITVGEAQLQSLNEQLARVSSDTAEKLAKYQQGIRFELNRTSLDTLPEAMRSPVITQLRTQQADLARRASDLASMYGPAYPAITQIRAQRAGLDRAIDAEVKRLKVVLKNDYEVAKAREESFRKNVTGLSQLAGSDNDVGVKLRELERANLANKALFENFLNKAKLAQEQTTFEEPDARLISPALEPTSPSFPKTKIIVPVAFVAGLLLGLGVASLLDKGGTRVVPRRAPPRDNPFILARIPTAPHVGGGDGLARYREREPRSDFARAIEALGAKLGAGRAGAGRVVTLVPLSPGEGATSLALCLAETIGRAGRKVLLIDADLLGSREGLSRRTGTADQPGFFDVIAGQISAGKAIVQKESFVLLPAGRAPSSPSTPKRLLEFLKETRTRFDLVLIDAPALVDSTDVAALGAASDAFALVASWDHLMRETFIAAIDTVADKRNFAGIILNRTTPVREMPLAVAS